MKKIVSITCIILIFIMSCQDSHKGKVGVILKHEEKNGSHFLIMIVKNNTSFPIYIPQLAFLEMRLDSIRLMNSRGNIINDLFANNELNHNISFYGPPIDNKVITDYCSDNPNISEEIDLELPPFNKRKEMIRSIIQYEYENLISGRRFRMPTEEDIRFIKSLIFTKYQNSIFLEPGEIYRDCITINTLFQTDERYRFFLHYQPNKKIEKYNYEFKFGGDTLTVTSKHLDRYMDYVLYDKPLVSDTLIINQ